MDRVTGQPGIRESRNSRYGRVLAIRMAGVGHKAGRCVLVVRLHHGAALADRATADAATVVGIRADGYWNCSALDLRCDGV